MAAAKAIVLDASAILQLVIPDSEAARQRAERLILDITASSLMSRCCSSMKSARFRSSETLSASQAAAL